MRHQVLLSSTRETRVQIPTYKLCAGDCKEPDPEITNSALSTVSGIEECTNDYMIGKVT